LAADDRPDPREGDVAKPRRMAERRNWAFALAVGILRPLLMVLTKRHWVDGDKLPERGGAVVVANHVSHIDPVTFAHFIHDHGRLPRYLAKAELFDVPVLGRLIRSTGQIPVRRLSPTASQAFSSAVAAAENGQLVVIYPEGTITRQPDLWPMAGKTGAARVALTAAVPVIPAAQWGAQEILWPYTKVPKLLPRKLVHAKAGDPVDLDDLRGQPLTPEVLALATERIMDAITALLEDIRGETAPQPRFDPRRAGVRLIGNPHPRQPRHPLRRKSR
jgi:1-acyl-sn-glycerol-3-phosphate acyltransferase